MLTQPPEVEIVSPLSREEAIERLGAIVSQPDERGVDRLRGEVNDDGSFHFQWQVPGRFLKERGIEELVGSVKNQDGGSILVGRFEPARDTEDIDGPFNAVVGLAGLIVLPLMILWLCARMFCNLFVDDERRLVVHLVSRALGAS